ncbi:MAG: hypothetical protein IJX92_03825 [Clostridia bacterium]|nr:hypothetical protein [Clostridia bacterium]
MKNGYFDSEKREFVITDMYPRRPLLNYLWNEEAVCETDQFGNGYAWMSIGTQRRKIEAGDRNLYIKDLDSGEYYSANRNYNRLPFDKHEAHVGLGYHTVLSEYKGISAELTLLVPEETPAVLYKVKVKNTTEGVKRLGVYFSLYPKPALSGHDSYGTGDYSDTLGGLLYSHDGFRLPNDYTKVFVGTVKAPDAYDVAPQRFIGSYSGNHAPIGVETDRLACDGTTFESNYIAALQFNVTLGAGEEFENYFCSFAARNEDECAEIRAKLLSDGAFEREMATQREIGEKTSSVITINTPDDYMNHQINVWLKRQVSLGKTWGRLYGKGFRDVCQDITAFVSFDPDLAKKRIMHALTYQYEDGNPIRMFEPNFRYPYNDGGAWIPSAVLSYLNESGDTSILDVELPYLVGDSYERASIEDSFIEEPYAAGKRRDSVLMHVRAAIDYLLGSRGEHNLVLWRGGDWNDSMNNVGLENKGESVWLSIATVKAINETQEILRIAGEGEELIGYYEDKKNELKKAIKTHGYNGKHYIYGINDKGTRIGDEDRIFLNPQSWSVLAGMDEKEDMLSAMAEVEKRLKCDWGYTQCSPSYLKGDPDIGRVSYFVKGVFENGSVYNHGVAFKIAADCILGEGERAYRTLKSISVDNPKNSDSGVEPYAVTNMLIGPDSPYLAGYAPMSWITGTAGWIYRAITEYMLGVKPTYKGLTLSPAMPRGWSGVTVTRRFRGETYNITFKASDRAYIVADGKEVGILPLSAAGSEHNVICNYVEK